jgi:hypothetical protein
MHATVNFELLGRALYIAQKVEFGLYGLAAHAAHLPAVANEKRFAQLTPDMFLSRSAAEEPALRATLGQLYAAFGDVLALSSKEFDEFLSARNLVVHNFWRETTFLRGRVGIPNPNAYLESFIETAERLDAAIRGLVSLVGEAAAGLAGRPAEYVRAPDDEQHRQAYRSLTRQNP